MKNADLAVLQPYCDDEMRMLRSISRSIISKFKERLTDADYDDFYSIANITLWQAYNSYNPDMGISFDVFLRGCLKRRFKTEVRDRHREKRVINQFADSLDKPINDENESNLIDIIPSDFDTFEEVMKVQDKEQFQKKVKKYIASLSSRQVNILNLLIDGYEAKDIQKILEIPEKEYTSHLKDMRSYEKVKSLF